MCLKRYMAAPQMDTRGRSAVAFPFVAPGFDRNSWVAPELQLDSHDVTHHRARRNAWCIHPLDGGGCAGTTRPGDRTLHSAPSGRAHAPYGAAPQTESCGVLGRPCAYPHLSLALEGGVVGMNESNPFAFDTGVGTIFRSFLGRAGRNRRPELAVVRSSLHRDV